MTSSRASQRRAAGRGRARQRSDVDRAVAAARGALDGAWGKTAGNRALPSPARAGRRDRRRTARSSPSSRRATSARRSRRSRRSSRGASRTSASTRRAIGVDRRPGESDRRLAALLLAEGAGRRLRPDRALELPADAGDVEACAGARRRLRGRAQARSADAARRRCALAELAAEVGFPAGVVNIVPGDGADGRRVSRRPSGVDKVAFTGSTGPAARSCALCSDPIKRVTLELGGKSPNLIFADADLDDAIPARRLGDLRLGRAVVRGAFARCSSRRRSTTRSSRA